MLGDRWHILRSLDSGNGEGFLVAVAFGLEDFAAFEAEHIDD